jgi:Ca2+/Na+ antiporter
MTYREKSAAASIAAIVLVYGFYAFRLMGAPKLLATPLAPVHAVGALVGSTVLLVIILSAIHIVIVARARPEKVDERDRIVGLRSVRNGYYMLAACLWGVAMLALTGRPPVLLAYLLVAGFAVAEVVRYASQLVYYRTGL